jgi:uncharacterized membrane protein affecting hemolysin expression
VRTLPLLVGNQPARKRLLALLEKVTSDERVLDTSPTKEQLAMVDRIRNVLTEKSVRAAAKA